MSRRLWIAIILSILIIIGVTVASSLHENTDVVVYGLVGSIFILYLSIYLFGGLAKLIIFFIYGFSSVILLRIIPSDFDVIMIFITTLIFVLNPLSGFENYLNERLSDNEIEPIRIKAYGIYEPYYGYRREMKNYFHLPQTRKLYVKPWYKTIRQLTALSIFGTIVFLLLYTTNDIFGFRSIRSENVITLYVIIILYVMLILVHKKGFTTMFRAVRMSVFIPMLYLVMLSNELNGIIRNGLIIAIIIFGISMIIYELITYYTRVSYQSYKYEDTVRKEVVFANALFEPFVYNDSYTEIANYGIEVSLSEFEEHLKEILVYANFYRFFITAFTYDKTYIHIYTEFNRRQEKRQEKFQLYLSSLFKTHVGLRQTTDLAKKFYEQRFFHNTEYIVARALSLAHLLNELEIKSEVIVSFVFVFGQKKDASQFQKKFPSRRLDVIEEKGSIALQTNIKCINFDYIIENNVRDVLLEAMVHKGTFVRIMLYY